jgi:hypothetical protein
MTAIFALAVTGALPGQPSRAAEKEDAAAARNAFFPLAAGNTWTYRCSAEGQFQFTKNVVIASVATLDGQRAYRSEMRIDTDPSPLVSYLLVDRVGQVRTALTPALDKAELVMGAAPKTGDRFGGFSVVSTGQSALKTFQDAQIIKLENFSADDPTLSEEKRMGWRGKIYGKGIGLLEETDGLGGECVLSTYRVTSGE